MHIIGHRGAGVTMKGNTDKPFAENTLPAFAYAFQHASGAETDMLRAKNVSSGVDLVLCHDNALNLHVIDADRRKRDLGYIFDKTVEELKALDVGGGKSIPSFDDVLALMERYRPANFIVELKAEDIWQPAWEQAREFCRRTGYPFDRIVFSSYDHEQLRRLRLHDDARKEAGEPGAHIGMLFNYAVPLPFNLSVPWHEKVYPETSPAKRTASFSPGYLESVVDVIRPSSLHICIRNFNDLALSCAQKHGLDIYAWTFNEKPPHADPSVRDFALEHKDNPHVHLITDFPAEIARAVGWRTFMAARSPS